MGNSKAWTYFHRREEHRNRFSHQWDTLLNAYQGEGKLSAEKMERNTGIWGSCMCRWIQNILWEEEETGPDECIYILFCRDLTFLALANIKGYVPFFFLSPFSSKTMELSSMCAYNTWVSVIWDEWENSRVLHTLLGPSVCCLPALMDVLDATEVTPHACVQVTKLSPCCASWKSRTGSVEAVLSGTWCGGMPEWPVGHPWLLGRELRQLGLWIPLLQRVQRAPAEPAEAARVPLPARLEEVMSTEV